MTVNGLSLNIQHDCIIDFKCWQEDSSICINFINWSTTKLPHTFIMGSWIISIFIELCNCKLGTGKQYNTVRILKYPKFHWPTFILILKDRKKFHLEVIITLIYGLCLKQNVFATQFATIVYSCTLVASVGLENTRCKRWCRSVLALLGVSENRNLKKAVSYFLRWQPNDPLWQHI